MLQFLINIAKKAIFQKLNTLYIHKRYLTIREALIMTTEKKSRFTVITNTEINTAKEPDNIQSSYHSNPMYEKLLNFRNLQEQQKKRFSVEDLLKW